MEEPADDTRDSSGPADGATSATATSAATKDTSTDATSEVGEATPAAEPDTAAAGSDAIDEPAASRGRPRLATLFSIALVVLALDEISKVIVVATLSNRPPVVLLGGLLKFDLIRNSGAAFSIGVGATVVFTVIACAVVVAILRIARRLHSTAWAISLGLLLGGALGNLSDRIFRSPGVFRGSVVDFIQFPHFAIFNLADSGITIGGCLMVLLSFRGLRPDGTRSS